MTQQHCFFFSIMFRAQFGKLVLLISVYTSLQSVPHTHYENTTILHFRQLYTNEGRDWPVAYRHGAP